MSTICARDLKPGHIVIDKTGEQRTVIGTKKTGNLIANTAVSPKTAAALEIELSGNLRIIVHPAQPFHLREPS